MLYVNPYDCKQPATSLSTWVIEMDQPETVQSIQVSVVDNTIDETEGTEVQRDLTELPALLQMPQCKWGQQRMLAKLLFPPGQIDVLSEVSRKGKAVHLSILMLPLQRLL